MRGPPLFRQRRSDTCALACLRMILAHYDINIPEKKLAQRVSMQRGGVAIEEVANLASQFGLEAKLARLKLKGIRRRLAHEVFPIVYLNRIHFRRGSPVSRGIALRRCVVHAVIPISISDQFVTFNDPRLRRRRRISRQKFDAAQRDLSYWCVVCKQG